MLSLCETPAPHLERSRCSSLSLSVVCSCPFLSVALYMDLPRLTTSKQLKIKTPAEKTPSSLSPLSQPQEENGKRMRVAAILTCSICCHSEWASAFSSAVRSRTATTTANRHRDRRTSLWKSASNDEILRSLLGGEDGGDQDPYSTYTHQIAVPLGDATLLHEALRPIQTSLVRDCPRLIRACIMPALLRLPLLYVDGSRERDRETERERDTERDRETERDRDRERENKFATYDKSRNKILNKLFNLMQNSRYI